jgi:hypothetical protein
LETAICNDYNKDDDLPLQIFGGIKTGGRFILEHTPATITVGLSTIFLEEIMEQLFFQPL